MPNIAIEIPDVHNTIQKNVQDSVVRNLLKWTGLSKTDLIYGNQEWQDQPQPGSTIGEQRELSYGATEKVFVEFEEQRDEAGRVERAPLAYEYVPFFNDPEFFVECTTSQVRYDVSTTLRRRCVSKTQASQWANSIQRKLDEFRDAFETEADFHYLIPNLTLNLIEACWQAKEQKVPSGETLTQYFRRGFGPLVTVIGNQAGEKEEFAVRHTQVRILAWLENEPTMEQEENTTNWVVQLGMRFQYLRPETIVMRYPLMFNNTLIDPKWWIDRKAPGLSDEREAVKSVDVNAADEIRQLATVTLPVCYPPWDMATLRLPRDQEQWYGLVQGFLAFDTNGPQTAFSLAEMGIVELSSATLRYLQHSYRRDPHGLGSIIRVTVFEDMVPLSTDRVMVDSNTMTVTIQHDINLKRVYRFLISLDFAWWGISDDQFDGLRQNPEFVKDLIETFFPKPKPAPGQPLPPGWYYPFPEIDLSRPTIPVKDLEAIINRLPTVQERGGLRVMITVQNTGIITYRGA